MNMRSAVASGIVVLDGGLATQLEAQGCDLSGSLWSARVLSEEPEQIYAAHRAFFAAGAQVATTASYQASFGGFAEAGIDRADAITLMRRSVDLARRAAEDEPGTGPRWVAASVGPYGAVLGDGAEYEGNYGLSVAELRAFHHERLGVLVDAGPDLLAVETIPCVAEVEALLLEVDGIGLPVWISLTAAGTSTRAGEPATEALAMAATGELVIAVGVNCTDPDDVPALLDLAGRVTSKPLVAYPNSGEDWDAGSRTWRGRPRSVTGQIRAWIDLGARLVGGCCRVTPADIRLITDDLATADPL